MVEYMFSIIIIIIITPETRKCEKIVLVEGKLLFSWTSDEPHNSGLKFQTVTFSFVCLLLQYSCFFKHSVEWRYYLQIIFIYL
jgi:hypothetical protein